MSRGPVNPNFDTSQPAWQGEICIYSWPILLLVYGWEIRLLECGEDVWEQVEEIDGIVAHLHEEGKSFGFATISDADVTFSFKDGRFVLI